MPDPLIIFIIKKHFFLVVILGLTVELVAMYEALSYALNINYEKFVNHDQFVIYSDIKSAIYHIISCVRGSRGPPIAYKVIDISYN